MTVTHRALWTFLVVALAAAVPGASAQNFGVVESDGSAEGYTLFAPNRGTSAYLIDTEGRLINQWEDPDGYSAGASMYLTKRGTLVRALLKGGPPWGAGAGIGGLIREYDWDGNVIWDFEFQSDEYQAHHDIELLPNGNVLITAYEDFTREECLAKGVSAAACPSENELGWTDHLVEVKPDYVNVNGGATKWVWRLWDHLLLDGMEPADHPELWDPSRGWANFNAIDYHPELDQILIGCNYCSELFVIDHDTTTAEAAGTDGDFLYRWGNPANYGIGKQEDRKLDFQHTVRWIKNEFGVNLGSNKNKGQRKKAARNQVGNIIAFNNNRYRPALGSWVIEIEPPLNPNGTYGDGPDVFEVVLDEVTDAVGTHGFFSPILSSAQKLPNGRYLIDVGASGGFATGRTEVYEVEADGTVVWKYIPPVFSFNPGRSASSNWLPYGKCPDGYVAANATGLPGPPLNPGLANPTQWFFRATRYAEDFKGFKGRDLAPGPYLEDLAGTTQPDCGHYNPPPPPTP